MSDYESSDYEEEEYEEGEEGEEGEEEDEYEDEDEEGEEEDDQDFEFSNLSINPNPVTSVFIGNPGVGKSTLLNQLLQEVRFKSGLAFGKGLTTTLQKETHRDGDIYIDTPGLSDIKLRTKAAHEIKEALTSSTGEFKVFFVITLEGGRIRPDDMTTMRLVLNAAKSIGTNYSIIISKASKGVRDKIAKDPQAHKDLLTGLNDGLTQEGHGTTSIFFANYKEELNDADNALATIDKELKLFVDTAVKAKKITQVQNIDVPNWENMFNKLCSELEAMKKDKQILERKMQEQENRYVELLKSQQAQRQQQYSPSLFQAVNKIVNPFAWF